MPVSFLQNQTFALHTKCFFLRFKAVGSKPGLPDDLFSNQKSQFGKIFEGLAMEDVGIFYGH
jgi:hypothetical protein